MKKLKIKCRENPQTKKRTAEILLYDDIGKTWDGGITAKDFAKELKAAGAIDEINARINSYGGVAFEGVTIYNQLKAHNADVNIYIDGIAASIASAIAMAGDRVVMPENAIMMLHNPWTLAAGNASELREAADILDKMKDAVANTYTSKSGLSDKEVYMLMDEESWLSAEEAKNLGLVDEITDEVMTVSASAKKPWIFNAPKREQASTPRLDKYKSRIARTKLKLKRLGL